MNSTLRRFGLKEGRAPRRHIAAIALAVGVVGISADAVRADVFVSAGTTSANSTVFRITDAGVVSTFATTASTGFLLSPRGLATSADGGFLYVANAPTGTTGNVLRFDLATGAGTVFATSLGANGIAVDSASNVYVTDPFNAKLNKFDSTGALVYSVAASGARGVALGSDGNVYVASNTTNDVRRYGSSLGNFLDVFAVAPSAAVTSPRELEFGADGNLFVVYNTGNAVYRYDATGLQVGAGAFATSGVSNPQGVTLDPLGNVYVANNSGGLVRKFSNAGVSLGNANSAPLVPANGFGVTYTVAVPEPGTLGLLAMGLLTTGGGVLARRRRRAT